MRSAYNLKIKEYQNGEKTYILHPDYYIPLNQKPKKKAERGKSQLKNKSVISSLSRTKNTIYDLSKCNVWEYFITLTFNPEKVNSRYDYNECLQKISTWLKNTKKRKSPNLKYLIVPDLHDIDKTNRRAFHFHGLISDIGDLKLIDSGKKDKQGRTIYNIKGFTAGWTTATKVTDTRRASGYITKYITKEMAIYTFNKKKYLCSQGLNRPIEKIELLSKEQLFQLDSTLENIANYQKVSVYNSSGQIDFTKRTKYYHIN